MQANINDIYGVIALKDENKKLKEELEQLRPLINLTSCQKCEKLNAELKEKGKIIAHYNIENTRLLEKIQEHALSQMGIQRTAEFYMKIQESCVENPVIMAAWQEFLTVAKMCDSEIEEKWKVL